MHRTVTHSDRQSEVEISDQELDNLDSIGLTEGGDEQPIVPLSVKRSRKGMSGFAKYYNELALDLYPDDEIQKYEREELAKKKLAELKKRAAEGKGRKNIDADAALLRRILPATQAKGAWWASDDFSGGNDLAGRPWAHTTDPAKFVLAFLALQDGADGMLIMPFVARLTSALSKAVDASPTGRRELHKRLERRLTTKLRRAPEVVYVIHRSPKGRLTIRLLIRLKTLDERHGIKKALRKSVGEWVNKPRNLQCWFFPAEYRRLNESRNAWVGELSLSILEPGSSFFWSDAIAGAAKEMCDYVRNKSKTLNL